MLVSWSHNLLTDNFLDVFSSRTNLLYFFHLHLAPENPQAREPQNLLLHQKCPVIGNDDWTSARPLPHHSHSTIHLAVSPDTQPNQHVSRFQHPSRHLRNPQHSMRAEPLPCLPDPWRFLLPLRLLPPNHGLGCLHLRVLTLRA